MLGDETSVHRLLKLELLQKYKISLFMFVICCSQAAQQTTSAMNVKSKSF